MSVKEKAKHILAELKGHSPFTLLGVLLGVVFMVLFRNVGGTGSRTMFAIFHPTHVVLSAMVTASMFKMHAVKKRFLLVLLVGYFGSVGIATLSDVIIPHIGARLLGLDIPVHAELHHQQDSSEHKQTAADTNEEHEHSIHLGFIEEWFIVNPAALLGVLIAYFIPRTKFPHTGHVLISTWASSSYLLMNIRSEITIAAAIGIFATLFIAVWLPCCISDIIFPLLLVRSDLELTDTCICKDHLHHSHPHIHEHSDKCQQQGEQQQ